MTTTKTLTGGGRSRRSSRSVVVWVPSVMIMLFMLVITSCAAPTSAPSGSGAGMNGDVVPAAMSTGLTSSPPIRVEIPAIGVDSDLMRLGLDSTGAMEVPETGFPAGWYTGAPTPGEIGPAIIAGHIDWAGTPGVFFRLNALREGDLINVTREDGRVAVFETSEVASFPKDEFPTDRIYGSLDHPGLRLITCGGEFDSTARSYKNNIVAFAQMVRVV